jgi:putative transposase
MQRTNIVELKPNKTQKNILKEMMLLSSCVYNMANYQVRQAIIKKEKIPSFFDIQKTLQIKDDYKLLGRSYSLPRIQIYSETNSARFKLIKTKTQKKVGLPKYLKNRKTNTTIPSYLVIDNSQYKFTDKNVRIPLSNQMRKKHKLTQFKIKYNGILKHKGKQLRGQIHYKNNKFYLYQSVEVKDKKENTNTNKVGIDLGIKRIFAIYTNTGKQKIIGNKRFFKQWKYYTNQISKEQQYLETINRKTSNKLKKLFVNRNKYQDNLYNNITSKLFKILNRNQIKQIYIGDVKNIRETKNNKKTNQMINNYWSFDKLYKKIQNKAEEYDIELNKITEEYSSRTCPICQNNNKTNCNDRIFKCSNCKFTHDRDIVGARNILTKGMYGQYQSIHRNEIVPLEVSL